MDTSVFLLRQDYCLFIYNYMLESIHQATYIDNRKDLTIPFLFEKDGKSFNVIFEKE